MPPLLCTLRHALVLETLFAALIHSKSFVVPRIIIINVAKCNLGKVKLQANAVSGLLLKRTWSEGCPQGPFAYLVTYVASHAGIFELIFADLLFSESLRILAPSPSLPFYALVSIRSGEYFPLNSSVWRCQLAAACRGGSRSQGCHGYLLAMPEAFRLPSNL